MSTATHAAPPTSQKTIFRSTRRGGSVLELRLTTWSDHEGPTITLASNGKELFIGLVPAEVPGLIKALTLLCDARKWKA